MRVTDIMKHEPAAVGPQATLAEAGQLMQKIGCGILPVVDDGRRVLGVITDRDICLALARADVPPSRVHVGSSMSAPAFSCRAEDDVEGALRALAEHRVRRLPVVDLSGRLVGLFSIDDAALHYGDEPPRAVHGALLADTLRAIASHPLPVVRS